MLARDLPQEFQDAGIVTRRECFRNGDIKTRETGKVNSVEETDVWPGFTGFRKAQGPVERFCAMDLKKTLSRILI